MMSGMPAYMLDHTAAAYEATPRKKTAIGNGRTYGFDVSDSKPLTTSTGAYSRIVSTIAPMTAMRPFFRPQIASITNG